MSWICVNVLFTDYKQIKIFKIFKLFITESEIVKTLSLKNNCSQFSVSNAY